MSGDPLRGNWHVVNSLRSALHKGEHGLSTVPGLLKRVLDEKSWRDFVTERAEPVHHERFVEFVTAQPMKGLGATPDLLYQIAPELTDALDREFGRKQRSDKIQANDNIVQGSADLQAPQGNSARRALRKLRADAPELHAEVLAGNLTAHGAMVKAGFRLRTVTVQPNPAAAARTLRKHLTAEQCAELARLLTEDN